MLYLQMRTLLLWSGALATFCCYSALAEVESAQVLVKSIQGHVTFSTNQTTWLPLEAAQALGKGTLVKTGPDSTADLLMKHSGTVMRMIPDTVLELVQLDKAVAGEEIITETKLVLKSGGIIGSQRKLAKPSDFNISFPAGTVAIKGTEYLVRADGAVTVLSGEVSVNYNLPGNGGSVKVTVPAGSSFNPATGQVVPTTPEYLANIQADVNTVRENAQVFKADRATVVVKPEQTLSPTRGNNGVGNGVDPQPPGNPPINDGPGTSPGNPGNRGGAIH
jgi:hypothetical protein